MDGLFHLGKVSNIAPNSYAIIVLESVYHGIGKLSSSRKSLLLLLKFSQCSSHTFLDMSNTFLFNNVHTLVFVSVLNLSESFTVTVAILFSVAKFVLLLTAFKDTFDPFSLRCWSRAFIVGLAFPLNL